MLASDLTAAGRARRCGSSTPQTHHVSSTKVKTLNETWDQDICVDSTEAKDLEPRSYPEAPLPVQREISCSPVLEEISFSWTEEPV